MMEALKAVFQRLNRSLNARMIVFLIMVLGASLSITGFFFAKVEWSNLLDAGRARIDSLADGIQGRMLPMMHQGRCKEMDTFFNYLALRKDLVLTRLIDPTGIILRSTRPEEKGKMVQIPNASGSGHEETVLPRSYGGGRTLRAIRTLSNEAKCSECHGNITRPLAYLSIDLSLASMEKRMRYYRFMLLLSAFGVLLAMSVTIYVFFSRVIKKRILDISRNITEVQQGNFEAKVSVTAQDELGQMASRFNLMVQDLHAMKERDKEQQGLLLASNESLKKSIEDLNTLYDASRAISRSLQLEEILRTTTENVTRSLGFDRVVLALFDENEQALVGKWSIGVDEDIVRRVLIPKEDIKGVLQEVLATREVIVVHDTSVYPVMERRGVRKCWEVLSCPEEKCPVFGTNELRCWMVTGKTLCQQRLKEDTPEEKLRICGRCRYLTEEVIRRSDIINLLLLGSHSFIALPLLAGGRTMGILLSDKLRSDVKEITEGDVKLLTTFMSHVSVAIENALLYQKLEKKVDLSQKQLEATNEELQVKVGELDAIRSFNESILQNIHGAIITYTRDGTITFANKPAAELLGRPEHDLLGKSVSEVFKGPAGRSFIPNNDPSDTAGFSGETEITRRSGERVPVEVFLSHLRDKEGNITGYTSIFRDITEKREMQVRMHRMDKLAALGQLASGIAHEIKNPLAGIGSAIQVLSTHMDTDVSRDEIVNEILAQIGRLDETIRNLLNFAKPGEPRLVLVHPRDVLQPITFLISQQVKDQHIDVTIDIDEDIPKIMVDPQQVQQALLNVMLNAVEAMSDGGKLSVSMNGRETSGPSKKPKRYVTITICDTGPGIPEEILAQIFNPFYTTKTSGTGLGLSITQRIIEQHNGRIDVKTEIGKGTSFTIEFST
jgi:PAS domain S-box-containing protein